MTPAEEFLASIGIEPDSAQGRAMLLVAKGIEHAEMSAATKRGIRAARARGVKMGRPKVYDETTIAAVKELRSQGSSFTEIAKNVGISRATVFRLAERDGSWPYRADCPQCGRSVSYMPDGRFRPHKTSPTPGANRCSGSLRLIEELRGETDDDA